MLADKTLTAALLSNVRRHVSAISAIVRPAPRSESALSVAQFRRLPDSVYCEFLRTSQALHELYGANVMRTPVALYDDFAVTAKSVRGPILLFAAFVLWVLVSLAMAASAHAGNRFVECGGVDQPICNKIPALDKGASKKLGCPGRNNYLSGGACYTCPAGFKRKSATQKMNTRGACVAKKHKVVYAKAKHNGKAKLLQCKGRNNYRTGKSCYVCPNGYTRSSVKTKMTSARACKRKFKPLANASRGTQSAACPAGQFEQRKRCLECPQGTRRIGVAGIDSRNCKILRTKISGARDAKWCDAGLRLAKLAPVNGFDRLENLAGSKKNKICARRFDLKAAALSDIPGIGATAPRLVANFAQELLRGRGKGKMKVMRRAIKRKDYRAAYTALMAMPPFRAIVETARERRHQTLTVGFGGEASLGVGYGLELGVAVDLARKRAFGYSTSTFTKGASYGGSGGVTVGFWNGSFAKVAYSQGFVTSLPGANLGAAAKALANPVDMSVGVWYRYYAPRRPEQLDGYSITYSVGQGETYMQYAEARTKRA